jgi:hypothetical protein
MEYKCDSDLSYNVDKSYAVDFAIVPHGKDCDRELWENALQFNAPIIEAADDVRSDWKVENAYISAMRKVDNDVFLRIYTGLCEKKTAKITVPSDYVKYAYTDGLMESEEWHELNGELSVEIEPYKVKNIRFSKHN